MRLPGQGYFKRAHRLRRPPQIERPAFGRLTGIHRPLCQRERPVGATPAGGLSLRISSPKHALRSLGQTADNQRLFQRLSAMARCFTVRRKTAPKRRRASVQDTEPKGVSVLRSSTHQAAAYRPSCYPDPRTRGLPLNDPSGAPLPGPGTSSSKGAGMNDKVIALDEALRMLIRIRDPALADKVGSIDDIPRLRDKTLPSYREADRVIYDESLEALCAAVREGRIRLRGTPKEGEPPIDIDKLEQQIGRLYVWPGVLHCPGRIYRNVHCYESDVIKVSKGVSRPQAFCIRVRPAPELPTTVKAETQCEQWLIQKMKASPKKRPKSKSEFHTEAFTEIKGLSGRAFNRAWKKAIKTTRAEWDQPGRPKKS